MTAGEGIVHSERTRDEVKAAGQTIHGMQAWVALPLEHEACAPSFVHHPKADLPVFDAGAGARLTVIAGTAFGHTSPVATASPTLYVDAQLQADATFSLPANLAIERAIYVVDGSVRVGDDTTHHSLGALIVLEPGEDTTLHSDDGAHLMLLGGTPFPEKRLIYWNFVASSPEMLDAAKARWQKHAFPLVPGDQEERIPLPPE